MIIGISAMDYKKMVLTPVPNYFSDLLARQTELAGTGDSQLTAEEIRDLSEKCDMSKMVSQAYKAGHPALHSFCIPIWQNSIKNFLLSRLQPKC